MAQLTIYIDEETQAKAKLAAKRANRSLSSWACEQLSAAADDGQIWPEDYFSLFGSIKDPEFKQHDDLDNVADSPREAL
ncbi:MAG: hypothetical protein AAF065_07570 [Verrucomicrobiota bacterium]